MSAATPGSKPSFWMGMRLWFEAMDEAVHTTEADLLAIRMERLEARIGQLETNARSGASPGDSSEVSTISERA